MCSTNWRNTTECPSRRSPGLSYAVLFSLSYVSARAVSMAALPGLAHAVHSKDTATFGSAWRQGLSYAVIAQPVPGGHPRQGPSPQIRDQRAERLPTAPQAGWTPQ